MFHMEKKISLSIALLCLYQCMVGCNSLEWDCNATTNTGTFTRTSNCTISGNNHVVVSNLLEITGSNTDMNNLVTISAASGKRHFFVGSKTDKLILRYIKLVGGDATGATFGGGSIYIDDGDINPYKVDDSDTLILFFTIISNNKASEGGGIFANGNIKIYNSSIVNNIATTLGGGLSIQHSLMKIYGSNISNNEAEKGSGGGLTIKYSDVIVQDTTISFNTAFNTPHADARGGGMSILYSIVVVQDTTISFNRCKDAGGGLYLFGNSGSWGTRSNQAIINITSCTFNNNEITSTSFGEPGGGALYFIGNIIATIRETSFISNMAKNNQALMQ